MNQIVELNPQGKSLETKLKWAGTAAVAAVASGVVIVGSLSVIAAGVLALIALGVVNFGLPVGARYIALKKQQALTALAEGFSEETIREDERSEGERLAVQQAAYKTQSAEFGNLIDELKSHQAQASDEEQAMLQDQIDELERVLADAETAIKQKAIDLAELRRLNGMYISLNRAAKAMKRGADQQRSAAEIQRVETARNAIKTRMREALAGQKIEALNAPLQQRLSASKVGQIAVSPVRTGQFTDTKEVQGVPNRR